MTSLRILAIIAPLFLGSQLVTAKTDLVGCTSYTSTVTVDPAPGYGNQYQTVIWFDPDTLEICQGVDCGGGRAPPKTVPGCPLYSGTETVTPSFLKENPLAPKTTATTAPSTAESAQSGMPTNTSGSTAPTLSQPTSTNPPSALSTTPPSSAPTGQRTSTGGIPNQSTAGAVPNLAAAGIWNLALGIGAGLALI